MTIKLISQLFTLLVLVILTLESCFVLPSLTPITQLLILSLLLLLLFLRIKKIQIMTQKVAVISRWVLIFLTIISCSLLLFEKYLGFRFVQTQFGLSYSRIFYLTLSSAILVLYQSSFNVSQMYIKKIMLFSPVYLFLAALFLFVRNNSLFRLIVQEDHLIEYSQFFLLLGSCYITFMLGKYWWRKEKLLSVVFFLASVLFLFVAGEEISWGQRLLGIATPESVAEKNIQDELTLHNYGSVFGLVYRGYILIGFYGSTAWIIFRKLKHKLSSRLKLILSNFIPDWYLTPYFAAAFFYNWDRFYLRPRIGEALWEEPMELLLIIGISIFFAVKYLRVNKANFINKLIKNE